jgi:hypothetical protein
MLGAAPVNAAAEGVVCRFTDKRFTEISGLATSHRHPGVLYLHNDSGDGPYIYAVDASTCQTLATLTVRGIDPRDAEDGGKRGETQKAETKSDEKWGRLSGAPGPT